MTAPTTQPLTQHVPFSQEAEEALLGAILLDSKPFLDIAEFLKPDAFFIKRHEYIWTALTRLQNRNDPIDYITVSQELASMKVLDEIGGQPYLTYLVNNTPSSVYAEVYGRLVERADIRRKMLEATDEIRKLALDEERPTADIIAEMQAITFSIQDASPLHRSRTAFEVASTVYEQVERGSDLMVDNPKYLTGIATGFPLLDWMIDGIPYGYITTIAGETGLGKTAWICNVALNASKIGIQRKTKVPAHVVIFSGEMHEDDLFRRMLSQMTGVNSRDIRRGFSDTDDGKAKRSKVLQAISDLSQAPITFETGQRLSTAGLRSIVRRHIATQPDTLFILDSILQVDTATPKAQQDKDWLKINAIMEELEEIALTYQVPILCTAQINRDGYGGKNSKTKPTLKNLKRASAIEEKSAVVVLMYRSEKTDEHGNKMIVLDIAKNRHGENTKIDYVYDKQMTEFHEVDYRMAFDDVVMPHYANKY